MRKVFKVILLDIIIIFILVNAEDQITTDSITIEKSQDVSDSVKVHKMDSNSTDYEIPENDGYEEIDSNYTDHTERGKPNLYY